MKRLLQRNRNVLAVLEQRQAQEEQRRTTEIRAALAPPRANAGRLQPLNTGQRSGGAGGAGGGGGGGGGEE